MRVYFSALLVLLFMCIFAPCVGSCVDSSSVDSRPIVIATIDGAISPASDDYLKSSLMEAKQMDAKLYILKLNTPGGLVVSMQAMVEQMLDSSVPIVVFVSPSGGGAISAGVFVAMSSHFAVMAPGTTIGAAHPVQGTGDDVTGDMRTKIENFAVSHIRAIAEQRGRNAEWAEKAVRESVAITDQQALEKKVIDFIAFDIDQILVEIEGRTINVKGKPVTLTKLAASPRYEVEMNFKQKVLNVLADPNIAMLLGIAAVAGIAIELYHPGAMLPGIVGVVCLLLSLISSQVLPINIGGIALLFLSGVLFVIEAFIPSFGACGVAGIICMVLGAIYFVDMSMVWSGKGFGVNYMLVGTLAGFAGACLFGLSYLVFRSSTRKCSTGKDGLIGCVGVVVEPFGNVESVKGDLSDSNYARVGRVRVMGELWKARLDGSLNGNVNKGDEISVILVESGMCLLVRPNA